MIHFAIDSNRGSIGAAISLNSFVCMSPTPYSFLRVVVSWDHPDLCQACLAGYKKEPSLKGNVRPVLVP